MIREVGWKPNKRLPDKSVERREIQIQTEEFLRQGGVIQVLPTLSGVKPSYQCFAFETPESETADQSEYKRRRHA